MDFCAEQIAFTMGNAFLKTHVGHAGQVGILRDHYDSEIFTNFGSQTDLPYKNISNGSKTILNRLL